MSIFDKTGGVKVSDDILHTLGADGLLYIRGINILDYLTCDTEILEKRAAVFRDMLDIPGLYGLIKYMSSQLEYIFEMVKKQSDMDVGERYLYSVKQIELYFDIIDRAGEFYLSNRGSFKSEYFIGMFSKIAEISSGDEYINLKKGSAKLIGEISRVRSISIGFNFNASLTPYEAGVISVNNYYIESGDLIDRILRVDFSKSDMSMAPLVPAKPACKNDEFTSLDYSIYSAMNKIFKKQIKQWEPRISKYMGERLDFLIDILSELKFIVKITEVQNEMLKAGLKLKKPVFRPMEERVFSGKGLYNPVLAMKLSDGAVVKNDFDFDEKGTVYLLTGPNSGGKSVFLSCVCIVQIMAQLGMQVPAGSLVISPASGIFVYFQNYGGIGERGRLADECFKISEIFREADSCSLCVFDEAFSSTDTRGATDLSENVLRALMYKKIRSIYSTHVHEIEALADGINDEFGSGLDYLTADITETGIRTYKINRVRPEGGSHSSSVAEKYGITYEELIK